MSLSMGRTERSRRTAGVFAVSVATFAWALAPLMLKQTRMPALSFAAYRLWMGVLVYVVVFALWRRRLPWATLRECALGGVFFGMNLATSFWAFQLTSVANATIIGALAPVFITICATRLFGERAERRDLLLVGVSLLGVAVVAVGSAGSPEFSARGDLFAGIGVVSWTAYWLYSKRARQGVGALDYMASVTLVGAILVTGLALMARQGLTPPRGADWGWVWLVTLVPGAIGHLLVAWSHRHVEAWLGSLVTQSQPVVGSVAAWALLGESLTPVTVAGGLVVLGATALVLLRNRRRATDVFDEPESPAPAG